MFDYTDPNFNIQEITAFHNTDGFNEISCYLDFALSTTIHNQFPTIDRTREMQYAKELLTNYLNGNRTSFTRKHNIRGNMELIGVKKLYGIFIKGMIEQQAFNENILHRLVPETFQEQCMAYITEQTRTGQLSNIAPWIVQNKDALIDHYVQTQYGASKEQKDQYEQIAFENPRCQQALEQLNLELRLSNYATR